MIAQRLPFRGEDSGAARHPSESWDLSRSHVGLRLASKLANPSFRGEMTIFKERLQ